MKSTKPGIAGTFHHQLLTATSNSFQSLKVVLPVLHTISSGTVPALISLLVAEVSNQKAEVRVFFASAAKKNIKKIQSLYQI